MQLQWFMSRALGLAAMLCWSRFMGVCGGARHVCFVPVDFCVLFETEKKENMKGNETKKICRCLGWNLSIEKTGETNKKKMEHRKVGKRQERTRDNSSPPFAFLKPWIRGARRWTLSLSRVSHPSNSQTLQRPSHHDYFGPAPHNPPQGPN
ncbi:hypothetical protein K402DRAFT_404136 [Aulographum hederae CBS 113979]|uniref:Secreted protein n=1 Tax=Aulographum hederae CBS 113979 TaxID=1176131 RepID=A0A6G1H1F0_9PEZI|nr:hypothetical protein K402DRAFT_404136 [Aulographum hederae CBS 113979]